MNLGLAYIVVAACAGYIFCQNCHYFKYPLARKQGYYAYLYVITAGIPLLLLSVLITWWVSPSPHTVFGNFLWEILLVPIFIFVSCLAANCWIDDNEALRLAWKDDLSQLLYQAMENDKLVCVTLENRKIYIGSVFKTLEPDPSNTFFTLTPWVGGYRNKDTLRLTLTHTYDKIINGFSSGSLPDMHLYQMVIPKTQIVNAHIFDNDIGIEVEEQQIKHEQSYQDR